MATNPATHQPFDNLKQLVQRAQQGDQTVLPALRLALDEHPEIWRQAGDLAKQAELAWLQLIAGNDLLVMESLQRKLQALKAEWAEPVPAPLERLLVDRIGACWLALHYAEATAPRMQGATPSQHVAAQKRINLLQQRYVHAIKALATLRKLVRPALSPIQFAACLDRPAWQSIKRREAATLIGVEN